MVKVFLKLSSLIIFKVIKGESFKTVATEH